VSSPALASANRTGLDDRSVSALAHPLGAPVLTVRGAVGLVGEPAAGAPPVVVPLGELRGSLAERIPGFAPAASIAPQFAQTEREITGPTLEVPYGERRQGEIDVPLLLGSREAAIGASARIVSRTPLPLADLTVLSIDDRRVKLRFSLGGAAPPPVPAPWPAAQALIVLRVNLITELVR
jgi:hypothetical protein